MTQAAPKPMAHKRTPLAAAETARAKWTIPVAFAVALLGATCWAYADTLVLLFRDWQHDENYSVGQLVPLAGLYLLWHDRKRLAGVKIAPCWWAIVLLLAAQAAWLYGLADMRESIERYAFVATIASLVLLVAGWQVFWRVKWILLFLFLMVPLPGSVHNTISGPLQRIATQGAVVGLELMGITVGREGNILVLNHEVPVAVAEACSGLRMLTAFVVVSAVLAYIVRRPVWQKATLVVSSVPIAIICNVARLIVTAFLFLVTSSEIAERFFHDFAGLTMMPIAVLLLIGELWIMSRMVIEEPA